VVNNNSKPKKPKPIFDGQNGGTGGKEKSFWKKAKNWLKKLWRKIKKEWKENVVNLE
jgi:hypothetical protein